MERFRAFLNSVKFLDSVPESAKKSLISDNFILYYTYDEKNAMVDWFIENRTNEDKYVSLYRGAILNGVSIPFYILGSEFAEVYFVRNESRFITSLADLRSQALAVLDDGTRLQIGAVFYLPARGVIQVTEFGYKGVEQLGGEVFEVKVMDADLFAVFYDYGEVIDYTTRYGHAISPPYDPYAISSLRFSIPTIGYMPTFRHIVPFNLLDDNKDNTDAKKDNLLSLLKPST